MKRFTFITLLCFCFSYVSAQQKDTILKVFDQQGRIKVITKASTETPKSKTGKQKKPTAATPATIELLKVDSLLKKQARDLLLAKVQETIRLFKSNHYKKGLHVFALYIWEDDSTEIMSYLKFVETSLKEGKKTASNNKLYTAFVTAFNNYLVDGEMTCFYIKSAGNGSLQLWRKNPFTAFLTEMNNQSIGQLSNNNEIKLNKEDIIETTYDLLEQKKQFDAGLDTLLKKYNSIKTFRKEFYDSLRTLHASLVEQTSPFGQCIQMFQQGWFKQWFWVRGGEIRLNPLDFTTNDSAKVNYRNILDSSYFKKITRNPFASYLEDRLDTLIAIQNSKDTLLSVTDKLINKITIPHTGNYFTYSAFTDIKYGQPTDYLTCSIEKNETKTIVVHNVLNGYKIVLAERNTLTNDKSPFQVQLDTLIGSLGALAALYSPLTSYSGLFDLFFKPRKINNANIQYPPSINYDKQNINDETGDTIRYTYTLVITPFKFKYTIFNQKRPFKNFLRDELFYNELYDEEIFNQIFYSTEPIDSAAKNKQQYENLLATYFSAITAKAIETIKKDSFLLANVISVYNFSTVPQMDHLKSKPDSTSIYYTKITETTPETKPVEKDVSVFMSYGKDSTSIGKFTYKVGMRYRFKLSAGIAYTFTSFNQSKAVEGASGISITNNIKQARYIAGLHIYWGDGLYNQSKRFFDPDWGRQYCFIGIGIPDPLGNIYAGIGRDLLPGLKLTAGVHIPKRTTYLIQNNSVQEEKTTYQIGGPFMSVSIDPTSFLSFLDGIKKLN